MRPAPADTQTRKIPILIAVLILMSLIALGFYIGPSLLDTTPPVLTTSGLVEDQRYRGSLTLSITAVDEKPGLASLTVKVDDALPTTLNFDNGKPTSWTLPTTSLADGRHTVSLIAVDRSFHRNQTQHTVPFYTDNTPPTLQVPPATLHVGQGKTLALFLQTDEPLSEVVGELFNKAIVFYPTDRKHLYRSFMGISVTSSIEKYPLTVKAIDLAGNEALETFQIAVTKTSFARGGYITLPPQKQRIMMDKSKGREDNAKRGRAYAKADQESRQLWEGKFIRPTEGRLTSPFGKYREYNTGVRRHHYGTDIANVVGTPVHASNQGIVTLAEKLHIYGNAVIINHGQGVSTSYNHLSEIHATAGERVEKGERIGLMGATGQATGSHLHWGMVIKGVAVAPEEWTERDFSSLVSADLSLPDGGQR